MTEVVKLAEAAGILGISTRAAESALRRAEIKSGYPLDAVKHLAANPIGRGARTDLKPTKGARMIRLDSVNPLHIDGWLALLGATRVLSARHPELTLHIDGLAPVWTGGPASLADAIDEIRTETLGRIPTDGVLPGVPAEWPPAGRDWWRNTSDPRITVPSWQPDNSDTEMWQGAILTPSGLLHPLIAPHAAQTVRGMLTKMVGLLNEREQLLTQALVGPGAGRTKLYPGGLWLALWQRGDHPNEASPGRDWLALMALPWLPAVDVEDPARDRQLRGCAGWEHTADGGLYRWPLWTQPVPATTIPAVLLGASTPGIAGWAAATRPQRNKSSEPPLMRNLPLTR